jgi:hypothetical protein
MILTLTLSLSSLWGDNLEYTKESFVRLNYITGNAYIQKAADLAYEEAVQNMPLTEGDRLGTTTGRVELYLENGNYLRLNNDTKIDLMRLPDKENDLIQVRIWSGNVYLSSIHRMHLFMCWTRAFIEWTLIKPPEQKCQFIWVL